MRHVVCRVAVVLAVLCAVSVARADPKTDRLVALGKVWGTVKFMHPYMNTRSIDWDAPLVAAIPKAIAATTDDELARVVDEMLATLRDPVTLVVPVPVASAAAPPPVATPASGVAAGPGAAGTPAAPKPIHRVDKGALVIDLAALAAVGPAEAMAALAMVPPAFDGAKAIVIDLRFPGTPPDWLFWTLESWAPYLLPPESVGPATRTIVHDGYAPQGGTMSSGGYTTYAKVLPGVRYRANPAVKSASPDVRVVFLVNQHVMLDAAPWTLQKSGHGFVVAQGQARYTLGDWTSVALPGGREAWVRTNEWAEEAFGADVTLRANQDGLAKALALARKPAKIKPRAARLAGFGLPRFVADDAYPAMTEHSVAYRLLALYRVWNVIHYFYPYLPLIGDWDAALPELVPRFESATTADAYAQALLELSTRVPDSHTTVFGHPAIKRQLRGDGNYLAVELRWIEQQAVVTSVAAPAAAAAGLAVGDVVLAIDGEAMPARIARLMKYVAGSTTETRYRDVLKYATAGPLDAVFSVRDGQGKVKELKFARATAWAPSVAPAAPAYRLLDADLGYAVLADLTVAEVTPMFEAFKDTKAIIFDMRGYPKGTAWAIAPRLNTRHAPHAARFHRRIVDPSGSGAEGGKTYEFLQPLPPTSAWIYQGKTIMLIDDRTQSQAEHTGLFFEAANGTKFVGTPSAGANGDITTMLLPGGVTWMFTGHDVRHADGRQLQRVGLQPDVRVAPTLKGLRAGKDEVLDRAIELVRKGK